MKAIPNLITLLRLILIPFIIYNLVIGKTILALILFIVAVISDKLDGYIARTLKQESYYGGMFDATADYLLIFSTIITLYVKDYLSLIILLILIAPKIITTLILTIFHKAEYKVTIYSKLTSFLLYIILPAILLSFNDWIIITLILILYILAITHWIILIKSRQAFKFRH